MLSTSTKNSMRIASSASLYLVRLLLTLALVFVFDRADAGLPAFPGAEGFGANTSGGRGGRVIEVTNLNDNGKGSFRAACESKGRRIIVFRTGGTIILRTGIKIRHPYITIACQTAPGGGICLRNAPSNGKTAITILTHDVVIRYLRVRPGPPKTKTAELNALAVHNGAYNVIIDHCSLSWAVDQLVSVWRDPHDVTMQWCFFTEALNKGHPEGPHSKGVLVGDRSTRISLHHNLFAHNVDRNPRIRGGLIDVVNNVSYNPVQPPGVFTDDDGKLEINYVGNVFIPGPNTPAGQFPTTLSTRSGYGLAIYVHENISPQRPGIQPGKQLHVLKSAKRKLAVQKPFVTPSVTVLPPLKAYDHILDSGGATLPVRDAVDTRIVREVKNRRGKIIDIPSEIGGWPQLTLGISPRDTDHDGMPDEWEKEHALDPRDPNDGNDEAPSGYTYVEEYINSLVTPGTSDKVARPQ